MRRSVKFVALFAVAALLGGCAVSVESRLDDFRSEGEAIADQIVTSIPETLVAQGGSDLGSKGRLAPSSGNTPQTPAWWEVETTVDLVEEPTTSEQAAAAVGDALVSDGWTKAEKGSSDPVYQTDEYRRDGWYVSVSWVRSQPDIVEDLGVLVVSPDTVRGDHDEISS